MIHKNLIITVEFFHGTFTTGFKETIEGTMHLTENDLSVPAYFVTLLYIESLLKILQQDDLHILVNLYSFAERFV